MLRGGPRIGRWVATSNLKKVLEDFMRFIFRIRACDHSAFSREGLQVQYCCFRVDCAARDRCLNRSLHIPSPRIKVRIRVSNAYFTFFYVHGRKFVDQCFYITIALEVPCMKCITIDVQMKKNCRVTKRALCH